MQSRLGWNPRIGLKQSIIHFEYLWTTYKELISLCAGYPYLTKNIKRGKLFYSVTFQTRQLKSLIFIRSLFYEEISKNKFRRSINVEIFHYLDYISLAHWIKGDDSKQTNGG